jgi:glycosyltransferase involved in cell wall biosynthesis
MSWWVFFIAGWILATAWIGSGILIVRFFRMHTLNRCARMSSDPEEWPSVSVIVAARNEVHSIETSLRSIAAMDYPSLEIIVVDDRSEDGTGKIIDRIAAEKSNIHVLHIDALPEGWLGKCHALHCGTLESSGSLLLFTDGDVRFAAETLLLAVRFFEANRLDHLVLCPKMTSEGYWEGAIKDFFSLVILMGTRVWAVSKPSTDAYIGIGAFNLLKREAYEKIGGHESLRMEVVDDILLGKRIKQHGYRQDILVAPEHLQLKWVEGVGGFVRGLEKNAFASINFSIPKLFAATGLMFFFYFVPYLGSITLRDALQPGYIASVVSIHVLFGCFTSRLGKGWRLTPAFPIAACIFLWTVWRSAVVTLQRGGVLWRDTFYPIQALKRK